MKYTFSREGELFTLSTGNKTVSVKGIIQLKHLTQLFFVPVHAHNGSRIFFPSYAQYYISFSAMDKTAFGGAKHK